MTEALKEAIATMRDCATGAELKGLCVVPQRLREAADRLEREALANVS